MISCDGMDNTKNLWNFISNAVPSKKIGPEARDSGT